MLRGWDVMCLSNRLWMGKMPGMEKVTAPQPEKDSPQDTPLVMKRGNHWESDDEDIISV